MPLLLSSNGGASDLDDADGVGAVVVAAAVAVASAAVAVVFAVVAVFLGDDGDVFGNTDSCVVGGDGGVVWVIVVLVMAVSLEFDFDAVEMAVLLVEVLFNADLLSVDGLRENLRPG